MQRLFPKTIFDLRYTIYEIVGRSSPVENSRAARQVTSLRPGRPLSGQIAAPVYAPEFFQKLSASATALSIAFALFTVS